MVIMERISAVLRKVFPSLAGGAADHMGTQANRITRITTVLPAAPRVEYLNPGGYPYRARAGKSTPVFPAVPRLMSLTPDEVRALFPLSIRHGAFTVQVRVAKITDRIRFSDVDPGHRVISLKAYWNDEKGNTAATSYYELRIQSDNPDNSVVNAVLVHHPGEVRGSWFGDKNGSYMKIAVAGQRNFAPELANLFQVPIERWETMNRTPFDPPVGLTRKDWEETRAQGISDGTVGIDINPTRRGPGG